MKKIFAILLALCLTLSLSITAFAATPSFKIPNISIPDISDNIKIELPEDFWDKWFDEHPLPEIATKPETPVISYAKYVHRTPYYGMSKHLEIQWNKIENAQVYIWERDETGEAKWRLATAYIYINDNDRWKMSTGN